MSKLRLLEYCPSPNDASSYYRGRLPITYLEGEYPELIEHHSLTSLENANWVDVVGVDVVFMQRPCSPVELNFIQIAHDAGRKVVVDYDDYLFNLPIHNTTYDLYMNNALHETLSTILKIADEIWVSTESLKQSLLNLFPELESKITVILNGHNDKDFPLTKKVSPVMNNKVLWRGGPTHNGDLLHYRDELLEVINTHEELQFYFFGKIPLFLSNGFKGKNVLTIKNYMNIFPYQRSVIDLNPMVNLILLEPHEFNQAKSNINEIEASYAGGYNFNYKKEDFVAKFNELIENKSLIAEQAVAEWKELSANHLLSISNKLRLDRFQQLVS